jgi:hypothetical protein
MIRVEFHTRFVCAGLDVAAEPNLVTSMGEINGKAAEAHADPYVKYYRCASFGALCVEPCRYMM